jgi:hypothetical protein
MAGPLKWARERCEHAHRVAIRASEFFKPHFFSDPKADSLSACGSLWLLQREGQAEAGDGEQDDDEGTDGDIAASTPAQATGARPPTRLKSQPAKDRQMNVA